MFPVYGGLFFSGDSSGRSFFPVLENLVERNEIELKGIVSLAALFSGG